MVKQLLAFVVYVGGYAAIPFIAKRFSGILGTLTGMVNDRTKGIIDRPRTALQKYAQDRRQGRRKGRKQLRQAEAANTKAPATFSPFKKEGRRAWRQSLANRQLRNKALTNFGSAFARSRAGGRLPRRQDFKHVEKGQEDPVRRRLAAMARPLIKDPEDKTAGRGAKMVSKVAERVEGGLESRRQKVAARDRLATGPLGAAAVKASKERVEQANMDIHGKGPAALQTIVLDDQQDVVVRTAALNRLMQMGMSENVRNILSAGYKSQEKEVEEAEKAAGEAGRTWDRASFTNQDPLVQMIKNAKHSDEFYKNFKTSAPDIAKSAIDDTTGRLQEHIKAKFLTEASSESASQWDVKTWEYINNMSTDRSEEFDGELLNGEEIKDMIMQDTGREIINNDFLRRKTNRKTLKIIENYFNPNPQTPDDDSHDGDQFDNQQTT